MYHGPFVLNSLEIWPEVFDKVWECSRFESGSINPLKIGEIPPSGLGGSHYWRTTEGQMDSWQDGHPMTTTVKHMQVICKLFEPRYKILPYMWRIGIECKMQQIWEVFYRCEEFACMLHTISLRAQISQNVKYWYEICNVLVPIFHALWRIYTTFSQCERGTCIKRLFWPPMRPKNENWFSQVSSY